MRYITAPLTIAAAVGLAVAVNAEFTSTASGGAEQPKDKAAQTLRVAESVTVTKAPCDRDCLAAKQPPCQTTCTGSERRDMARESASLRQRLGQLNKWRRWASTINPYRDWLGRLRACESSGNWRIVNSLGYAGAYQFGSWAWHAAGGTGRPQDAHPLEQSYRAVVLRRAYGLSQWECKVGS